MTVDLDAMADDLTVVLLGSGCLAEHWAELDEETRSPVIAVVRDRAAHAVDGTPYVA